MLIAFVASALLFGCGGGAGGEANSVESRETFSVEASTTVATASPVLTKAQFVQRVNRACRKSWPIILGNWEKFIRQKESQLGPRKRFIEAVKAPLSGGITFYIFDNIFAIGAPRGDEREVEEMIGAMQTTTERIWRGLVRPPSISRVVELYAPYTQPARRYGLDDCLIDEAHLRPFKNRTPI